MQRHHDENALVELGTASIDTRGQQIPSLPEDKGYQFSGFIAD